jgi:chromosome segregation protein
MRFLERELAWAEVTRRETITHDIETNLKKQHDVLTEIERENTTVQQQLEISHTELGRLKENTKALFEQRLSLEREKTRNESTVPIYEELLKETGFIEIEVERGNPQTHFKLLKTENLKELIQDASQQISKIDPEITANQTQIRNIEETTDKVNDQILQDRIRQALLQYRRENATADVERLESELRTAKAHLDEATKKAEESGTRIVVVKSTNEIFDEIRTTEGHLAALADVSEDIERMYESYSKLYLELKEKAQLVAENREKALEEVKTRMLAWREVIQNLLTRVNLEYQSILNQAQAVGEVRLANEHDIEAAGLEILVGFKGGKPVPLDAYTQSGGERTTATMSFLLALQQHVRSPFRAVDEYDIHMDPRNREVIAKMLISTVNDSNAQYIIITPSQITFTKEQVNIITVQNIEGKSIIREVAA